VLSEISRSYAILLFCFPYQRRCRSSIWRGENLSRPAAPSSSILFPFLLAGLSSLGLGALLPLAINVASTASVGVFALLLARESDISLSGILSPRLLLLTAVVAIALDLPGLAVTGFEHSRHVAMTVVYLLGLVRFVISGRCDWWWISSISRATIWGLALIDRSNDESVPSAWIKVAELSPKRAQSDDAADSILFLRDTLATFPLSQAP
jgi:hypothetical protein